MFYWKKFKVVLFTQLFYYYCYYQLNLDERNLLANTFFWLSFMRFCAVLQAWKVYVHSQIVACDVFWSHLKYLIWISITCALWCDFLQPSVFKVSNPCIPGKFVLKGTLPYKLSIWNDKVSDSKPRPWFLFLGTPPHWSWISHCLP